MKNKANEIYIVKTIVDFIANSEEYKMLYEVKWKESDLTTLEPVDGLDRNSAVDVFWKNVLNKTTSGQPQSWLNK